MAITHADQVLHWQENLGSEEMPPRWMWPHAEELETWFAQVEADRQERYGGGSSDDMPAPKPEERNTLVDGFMDRVHGRTRAG